MKKLLITLLISISLCIPAFVSAQEVQLTGDTNTVIPVYFFIDKNENIFSITPISEELFLWYYLYQGDTGALYANPHALTMTSTTVSTTAYTYDNNGNVTSYGDWTNIWDYMNRLLQSVNSVSLTTTTYEYDQSGQRVYKVEDGVEFIYPNKYYTIEDGTVKKHIYAGGVEVASVQGATTTFHHTDHLSGSSVESDHEGYVIEVLDYYPFGSTRIDEKYTDYENDNKFTGHEYDDSTDLYYMGARYQDPGIGRFVSQDPIAQYAPEIFLSDPQQMNSSRTTVRNGLNSMSESSWKRNTVAGGNLTSGWVEYLADPQSQNSYAYARNNPLAMVDPDGEWAVYFSPIIPGINVGLGGEIGNSWAVGFASDGTFGLSTSVNGGGLAGIDASINWTAGYSTADTWSDTLGTGEYASVGGKYGAGFSVTSNFSDGSYTGAEIDYGVGLRALAPSIPPVAFSGGINKTYPVFESSISRAANMLKAAAEFATNSVSNGAKKITDKFKK